MSAEIISVDFNAKKRKSLEEMAAEILAPFYESSLGFVDQEKVPFGGAGIDGMWKDPA